MQRTISTNIHLPEEVWRAVKIRAAEQGRSMKDLILEGLKGVLGRSSPDTNVSSEKNAPSSFRKLCLRFSGTAESGVTDGSVEHDRYIYDKDG